MKWESLVSYENFHRPIVDVHINGNKVKALIDTGSPVCCLTPELAERLVMEKQDGYDDFKVGNLIFNKKMIVYPFYLGWTIAERDQKYYQVIIGTDLLVHFGLTFHLDGKRKRFALE
jgi:hypothetical protein